MIDKIIKKHPSFCHAQDIADICKPLDLLNISYFAHVNIDSNKQFSALSSNPQFGEHYLKNHYYNSDIHMAEKNLGKYVIWDSVNLGGKSQKMHTEASDFGIKHTFTIIQKNINGSSDFYHFASNISNHSINQMYLSRLDLLKVFILQFKEKINKEKHLLSAYSLKIVPYENLAHYSLEENEVKAELITQFHEKKNQIVDNPFLFNFQFNNLSPREQTCLYYYIHGKSPREISSILFLSKRTIEQHMENIKIKLNVLTKSELIEKVLTQIYANLL
jgi:DNA-binding CsgD family transcriptional regulator